MSYIILFLWVGLGAIWLGFGVAVFLMDDTYKDEVEEYFAERRKRQQKDINT